MKKVGEGKQLKNQGLENPQKYKRPQYKGNDDSQGEKITETTLCMKDSQISSRSFKKKVQDFQISIEDDFMKEHELAYHKETQNFKESVLCGENYQLPDAIKFSKKEEQSSFHGSTLDENPFLNVSQKIQFAADLQLEQKLRNFLMFVQQQAAEEILHELYYIVFLAWEEYLKVKEINFTYSKLIKASNSFVQAKANYLYEEIGIKYLNFLTVDKKMKRSESEVKESFRKFLTFWVTTVFLLIEEYFENPFSCERAKIGRDGPPSDNESESSSSTNFGKLCRKYHHPQGFLE